MKSSELLKSYRGKNLKTQNDVADNLGIARTTYTTWENNPLNCPIDVMFKILVEINANIDDFLIALKQDFMSYNKN